ncbi:MAG TPA: hypothetical protein VFN88_10870 [Caulobacteraceae bacterium]|nr:hypothetical protein [Caulobacteraceae bacterium]
MGNKLQFQVKLFFLVAFFFIAGGLWWYQLTYVRPAKECEENGNWWYKPERLCATPVRITDLTGRHMDDPDLTTEQGRAQAAAQAMAAAQAKAAAQQGSSAAPPPVRVVAPATK